MDGREVLGIRQLFGIDDDSKEGEAQSESEKETSKNNEKENANRIESNRIYTKVLTVAPVHYATPHS
jgi:hypothetical protein